MVLESPGIYLWFNLTKMPFMYKTPSVINLWSIFANVMMMMMTCT